MYTKKKFNGTPGNFEVLKAQESVEPFHYSIYSEQYGCIGYWKGHKESHADPYWVLKEEDANLFAASKEMLDVMQDLACTQVLPQYWQDKVEEVLKKAIK